MSLYGYVKKKVLWYRNNSANDIVDITRYVRSITSTRTTAPQNNRCDISILDNDLLYSSGVFVPQENDKIFIYAKIITDAGDTELNSLDIVWNGKFVDHKRVETNSTRSLTLNIIDWGYDVFNSFHTESYNTAGLKTDEIVKRIVQTAAEQDDGNFSIDTSLVATTRNDSSAFPVIQFSQVNKPISELLTELSLPLWTNSEAETTADARVISLPMILDFRGNYAIWQEQSLNTVLTITDASPYEVTLNTTNEGSTNRLIVDCGDDLEGNNITKIIRDEKSSGSVKKDSQKNRVNLAGRNETYDNTYHYLRAQATTEAWTNAFFREKVEELARSYASFWFDSFGRGKPQLKVVAPKIDIELGELINMQKKRFEKGLYRVTRITQDIGSTWSTTLTMEKFEV